MADLSSWRVLIIEDNKDAREMLVPLLVQHHASVATAANAEEAMAQIKSLRPTLALVDLALPGMDGWEMLETLRAQPEFNDVQLVAMTAFDFPDVGEEALDAGFIAYIPKPINARTFVDDLVKIVNRPRR